MPTVAISKIINDTSGKCADNTPRLTGALSYIVKVYYGLNPENLTEVLQLAGDRIVTRFPDLTFEQLNLAYSEGAISKRDGVSLTVDELCAPIASFVLKIAIVNTCLAEEATADQKKKRDLQLAAAFKQEAMNLYLECLNGEQVWTGTEFQAHSFAHNFGSMFDQPTKDEIWLSSKREYFERREQYDTSTDPFKMPPPPPEKIFSRRIVEAALTKSFILIVD